VGSRAIDESAHNPQNTLCDIRQLLGRKFHDPEFQTEIKYLPYDVMERMSKVAIRITIDGQGKWVAPEEILAELLKHLKAKAEQFLGRTVNDVVLSAPDYFSDEQRQSIKDASLLAGINVLRIINESKAASFAYDAHNWKDEERKKDEGFFLVYHLGAKCSYAVVLSVEEGVFETLSTARSGDFGGVNLDDTIIEDTSNVHSATNLGGLTENMQRDGRKRKPQSWWKAPQLTLKTSIQTHTRVRRGVTPIHHFLRKV
jgi:molecular chaperone DnaK (HSP70)